MKIWNFIQKEAGEYKN